MSALFDWYVGPVAAGGLLVAFLILALLGYWTGYMAGRADGRAERRESWHDGLR